MQSERSLLVPGMVYLGAAILIGLPAMAVLSTALGDLLDALGLEAVTDSDWGSLLVLGVSLLIGLQLAVEVTAVRLGGIEALGRGPPRVALVRYVLFSLCAFALLVAVTWVGLSVALAGSRWVITALGLLVGLAGLVVLYRGARAFVTGTQGGTDPRRT